MIDCKVKEARAAMRGTFFLLRFFCLAASVAAQSWVNIGGGDAPIDSNGADLLILMDATGSMSSWINAAKTEVLKVVNKATTDYGIEIRASFIAYRDEGDSPRFQAIDFRSGTRLNEVTNLINSVTASGGGDFPEDVAGGLWQAYGRSWRATGTKILVHVADAPAHYREYHPYASSDRTYWTKPAMDPKEILTRLGNEKGVCHYFFLRLQGHTDQMTRVFKETYERDVDCAHFHITDLNNAYGYVSDLFYNAIRDAIDAALKPDPPALPRPPSPPPPAPPPPRKGATTSVGNLGQTFPPQQGACVGMISSHTAYTAAPCGEHGAHYGWDEQSGKGPPALPAPATDADIYATHLADLNGDGIDDLIVLTHGGQHSYVYLNPGNGDFSGVTGIPIGTGGRDDSTDTGFSTSVAVADVNRDGIVDLVIGNDGTSNMIYLGVAAPTRGDFSGVVGLPFGSANGPTTDVAVGDVDGDGAMDIATANDGGPNVMYWGDPTMAVGGKPDYARLPINSPLGGTSGNAPWPWSTIGTRADGSTSIALGDLDKDGDLECVAVHAASNARARAIPLLALHLCDLVVLRHAPPCRPAMVHGSDARLPSMAYAFYLAPAASWLAIREAHPAVCTSTTHTTPPSPSPTQSPSSYRRLSMHHTAPASFLPCQAPRPSLR